MSTRRYTTQPQYAAPIDYDGLGRGAKFLFNPALGPVDLVTGRQWAPNATPEIEVANGGRVFAFNGGGDRYGIVSSYPELIGNGTFFISLPKVGPASTFGHVYLRIAGILSLQVDNSGRITLSGVNIGPVSDGWFSTVNRSLIFSLGPSQTRVYMDGRLVVTSATTMPPLSSSVKEVMIGGSSAGMNWDTQAQVLSAGWVSSLWGDSEASAFHENPHQLFKTRTRRLWLVESSAPAPQDLIGVVATASSEVVNPGFTLGGVTLSPSLISSAAEAVVPLLQTGSGVLSPLVVSAGATAETPLLQAGEVLLAPSTISAEAFVLTPAIGASGVVNLAPSAAEASGGVATPELLNGVQIGVASVSAQAEVSAVTLSAGAASLTPSAPQVDVTIGVPDLIAGNAEITAVPAIVGAGVTTPSLSSGTSLSPDAATASAQPTLVSLTAGETSVVVAAPIASTDTPAPVFQLSVRTLDLVAVLVQAEASTPSLLNEGEGVNLDRLYSIGSENRSYAILGEPRAYTI